MTPTVYSTTATAPSNGHATKPDAAAERERQQDEFIRHVFGSGCGEIRVFEVDLNRQGFIVPASQFKKTMAGWFSDPDAIKVEVKRLKGASAYATVNPVNPVFLARKNNRLDIAGTATSDEDIVCLRWLFADFDAKRLAGISSTTAELEAARDRLDTFLDQHPNMAASAIWGCSGNGFWCLVRLPDYPNDATHRQLIADALDVLDDAYSDKPIGEKLVNGRAEKTYAPGAVVIDVTTKNPARVMPMVGTLKCKGDPTPDRPHRYVTLDSEPGDREPFDLIAWVAEYKPAEPDAPPKTTEQAPTGKVGSGASIEDRIRGCLEKCEPAIDGQKGHNKLFYAANVGPGFDLTEGQTIDYLTRYYNPRCVPEWSPKEIAHKVKDAFAKNTRPLGFLRDADDGTTTARAHVKKQTKAKREAKREAADQVVKLIPNYVWVGEPYEKDSVRIALRVGEIDAAVKLVSPEWPKRVGPLLFVEGKDGQPCYLDSVDKLFAFYDSIASVDWGSGESQLITQKRYYEHLRQHAPDYDAVQTLPHFPPRPRTYYMHPEIVAAENGKVDDLLDFFSPATPEDRELIRALILTPFWGGYPGSRPAFLITSDGDESYDPEKGRGVGKSALSAVLGPDLFGGLIDVSANADFDTIKTRALSPKALSVRVARIDNIKSPRFSWDELEGLITSPVISGHMMYQGEGTRPNDLTWLLTVNGANLSKDLSQRIATIMVTRPVYSGSWERDVREFIVTNKLAILANIKAHFERPPEPIATYSRWAAWEAEVLARTRLPQACQRIIAARRNGMDDDDTARDETLMFIAAKLKARRHDPDDCSVRLPSQTLAEWLTEMRRKPVAVNHAVREIKQLGIKHMTEYRTTWGRGMLWTGPKCSPETKPVDLNPEPFPPMTVTRQK